MFFVTQNLIAFPLEWFLMLKDKKITFVKRSMDKEKTYIRIKQNERLQFRSCKVNRGIGNECTLT